MGNSNYSLLKSSFLAIALLAAAVCGRTMVAQGGPSIHVGNTDLKGYPEDWSHRYVVFSNPGTEQQALQKGTHDQWQKIVNNPRYVIQQLKNRGDVKGPASIDAKFRREWNSGGSNFSPVRDPDGFEPGWGFGPRQFRPVYRHQPQSTLKRDWSVGLGGPGLAAGQYPAKYNFDTSTASCSDYVVFPTGATGSSTQSTILAETSVYSGCPLFSGGPVVYWSYNTGTGSIAKTSPVISLDGTQVAFVQVNGTAASLVLLKMTNSGSGVVAPTSVTLANYRACTAPCQTTIALGANDTNSAPFYVYEGADKLFVGDDAGKVHEVTGAFLGTPALDPTGWPVTASSEPHPELYSPVFDTGTSGRIFVTDESGFLHSFVASPVGAVGVSGHLETNTTFVFDSPIVDPTAEQVYTFIGYSGDTGNTNPSYINRFPAGTALAGGTGTGVAMGNGSATTNPTTSNMHVGAFDNQFYLGTGTTGNLYVCENGKLYQVPLSNFTAAGVKVFSTIASTISSASTCSPVTEFLGTKAVSGTPVATTLSATITNATSPITVASGTSIAINDFIKIDSEILKVTAGGGTTSLTVSRGQQGTTAAAHTSGAAVADVEDWLFTSVIANGNATGCTGACVYNFNVLGAGTTGTATAGLAAAGGTSGIVIDSSSTGITGDEEIYYTLLGGTSGIQASQAALQ